MIYRAVVCSVALLGSGVVLAQPDPSMELIAIEGVDVPGQPGEIFGDFGSLVSVDDQGAVFWSTSGASGGGFRTAVLRTLDQDAEIIIRGDVVPAGLDLVLGRSYLWSVAPNGLEGGLAVHGNLASDQNSDAVFLIRDAGNRIVTIDGDPFPDGVGTFFTWSEAPLINRSGEVLINGGVLGSAAGAADDRAVLRFDAQSDTIDIALREGELDTSGQTITGSQTNGRFVPPNLAEDGSISFRGVRGLFRKPSGGTAAPVSLFNTVTPFGSTRDGIIGPAMAGSGSIGFAYNIFNQGGFREVVAVLDSGVLRERQLSGPAPTPEGGEFGSFRGVVPTNLLSQSGDGQLVFVDGTLDPSTSPTGTGGSGLFFTDGQTVGAIARRGLDAPGGGFFSRSFGEASFTAGEGGHVLFKIDVNDDFSNRTNAAFLWTPGEGTRRLISEGDLVDGETVLSIADFPTSRSGAGPVNADGVVALVVILDNNGREAVLRFGRTEPCLADVNQDGDVNGLDFGAWLNAFNAQDPRADQNQDGEINGLDFGAWLGNFNAGCD